MVVMKVLIVMEVMIMMMTMQWWWWPRCALKLEKPVQLNVYLTREGYCKIAAQ